MIDLPKKDLRTLLGLYTGHYPTKGHLHKMGLEENGLCRLCHEEMETTEHLLCNCLAAARRRIVHLDRGFPTPGEIAVMAHKRLLRLVIGI